MVSKSVQCPKCGCSFRLPDREEFVVCPSCEKRLRFRRPAADAPNSVSAPILVSTPGSDGAVSASLTFWGSTPPEGEDKLPAPTDPLQKSSVHLSLDDARSLWEDAVGADGSEGQTLRGSGARPAKAGAAGAGAGAGAESLPVPEGGRVGAAESLKLATRTLSTPGREPEGDFEKGDFLGRGGMGVVFAARQTSLGRRVAVKTLLPTLEVRTAARNKFVAEALVTGALDHPNIVPVHELGMTADGVPFYVMKEVRGRSWSETLGHKSTAENVDILLKVGDAVAFAHGRGVIHRDLKPDNVMIGDYGEVLLMDWGLAAAMTKEAEAFAEPLSPANARAGTPAFIAPEMATADIRRIGYRSDVYLLGGILYEIATGLRPHHGDNVFSCLYQAMRGIVQPTARRGELVTIALKAMAKDPADRYGSVSEMMGVVREYQTHRESIEMSRSAGEWLEKGTRGDGYEDLSRAMFGYEEAVRLWELNGTALLGAAQARLAYARRAAERKDFGLAETLATPLLPGELAREFANAPRERQSFLKARNRVWEEVSQGAEEVMRSSDDTKKYLEAERMRMEAHVNRGRWMGRAAMALLVLLAWGGVVAAAAYMKVSGERDALRMEKLMSVGEKEKVTAELEKQRGIRTELDRRMAAKWLSPEDAVRLREMHRTEVEKLRGALTGVEDELQGLRAAQATPSSLYIPETSGKALPDVPSETEKSSPNPIPDPVASQASATQALVLDLGERVTLECVLIAPGMFMMGSPAREARGDVANEVARRVRITKPYHMGVYEVTQRQYRTVMGENPSAVAGDQLPVGRVTWYEAAEFCRRVSERTGRKVRLPTEAEWEYACRAGTATPFSFGFTLNTDQANYKGDEVYGRGVKGIYRKAATRVGTFEPNAWGLYDMHGNVAEWCLDWAAPYDTKQTTDPQGPTSGVARVIRGGSWATPPVGCRSAQRAHREPHNRPDTALGFRVVVEATAN